MDEEIGIEDVDLEEVLEAIEDGWCPATDGCEVEVDGVCPHGCPSMAIVLGLI